MKPTVADVLQQIEAQSPEAVAKREQDAKEAQRTQQLNTIQATIIESAKAIINYLDGKVTKTEVINQIQSVRTPDSEKVVTALNSLHDTLKTHENTDLSGVTTVLTQILKEAQAIPKTHKDIRIPEPKDYSKQLDGLTKAIQAVESVVKAQKLVVQPTKVDVAAPNVQVDAPNLKPLQTSISEVVKAVESIVIPEYKTDNKAVEKLLKDSNKLLKDLLDKPVSRGGGGGGIASFRGSDGNVTQVQLQGDGSIPVTLLAGLTVYSKPTAAYELVQYDDSSSTSYEYYLYSDKDANYYVKRVDTIYNYNEFKSGVTPTTGSGFYAWVSALTSWQTYGAAF